MLQKITQPSVKWHEIFRMRLAMTYELGLVQHVMAHSDFVSYEHEGEGEVEERDLLSALLTRSIPRFLERYGKFIREDCPPETLRLLRSAPDPTGEVAILLQEIDRRLSTSSQRCPVQVRNRRFAYLQHVLMSADSSYFSEEEMKLRCPYTFWQYVGRYKSDNPKPWSASDPRPLSEVLLDRLDHDEERGQEVRFRRREEVAYGSGADGADAQLAKDESFWQECHEELVEVMKQRFLDGEDADFVDYSEIDQGYMSGGVRDEERDAQDAYFESED